VALEETNELRVELPTERPKARAAAAAVGGGIGVPFIPNEGLDMERYVADLEKGMILHALKQSNGVQTRAAELLKLSYRSFRHLLKKYDI
jgi:two-component system response regulator PilR (NtrC family)